MVRILFVQLKTETFENTFIRNDLEYLKKHYEVRSIDVTIRNLGAGGRPLYLRKTMINLLQGLKWADIVFVWGADIHSLGALILSKIFMKKIIVVIYGHEIDCIPELTYGFANSESRKRRIVEFVLNHSNRVIVQSKYMTQCIRNYFPNINGKVSILPLEFNPDRFVPNGDKNREVLTVALANNINYARLKGIDTYIETASRLPDIQFTIVGLGEKIIRYYRNKASPNVAILPPISQDELIKLYQKTKVYCQFSYSESFGCSIAESMLCECVPVCRTAGNMPELISGVGYEIPQYSPEEAILLAITSENGKKAREKIMQNYPPGCRENALLNIVKEI
ncbi:MAG: glycosyltransferase [Methanomicrobiales archaeon]|nr:glycosyltransferase [Methanomicrobiales archaeon]